MHFQSSERCGQHVTDLEKGNCETISSFCEELKEELKLLKQERRYHNQLVKDPLFTNLEVPKWVLNERAEICSYINDYRYSNSLTGKITQLDVVEAQKNCRADNSKEFIKYYAKVASQPSF